MFRRTLITTAALGAALLMSEAATAEPTLDPENTLYLDLKGGRVVIQLLPDLAPKAVARVKELTREGFYNNTPFHRVIPGFMAQGGDPTGTGTGGSKLPNLPAEFTNKAHFLRGTVGAARTQDPNTANSQFFICFAPAPFLDGQYTIWGRVVSGMEYVDQIKKGSGSSGSVSDPDRIVRMQVAADAKS
jgi:peptidylprolyl isomerase